MEFFLTLTFLFAVGALCGWVIELFFRRLNSKKWINPGFLHGPYLPCLLYTSDAADEL